MFDEDRPSRPAGHEIGADLSLLSVDEIDARIALLKQEIDRLMREKAAKTSSRGAAESLFRQK